MDICNAGPCSRCGGSVLQMQVMQDVRGGMEDVGYMDASHIKEIVYNVFKSFD